MLMRVVLYLVKLAPLFCIVDRFFLYCQNTLLVSMTIFMHFKYWKRPKKIVILEKDNIQYFKPFDAQMSYGCDSMFYIVMEGCIF